MIWQSVRGISRPGDCAAGGRRFLSALEAAAWKGGRHVGLPAAAIALAALAIALCTGAEAMAGDGKAEPGFRFEIMEGGHQELCQQLLRGMQERRLNVVDTFHWRPEEFSHGRQAGRLIALKFCGAPFPPGSAEFAVPEWKPLDPAQHMDLVRDMFYWSSGRAFWGYMEFNKRQVQKGPEIVSEMQEQIWAVAEAELTRLAAEGALKLEVSQFDADGDGKPDVIYRMSPVLELLRGMKSPWDKTRDLCTPAGLPDGDRAYLYYTKPKKSPRLHGLLRVQKLWPGASFFYWNNQIYLRWQNTVYKPVKGSFGYRCVFVVRGPEVDRLRAQYGNPGERK